METVIQSALEQARVRADDQRLRLTSTVEGHAFEVCGDHLSIEETVTNLILNAIKYSPEETSVEVRAVEDAGHICVSIRDEGIGIPEDELPSIFDEFYRASNARAREKDGTGLGLSIARQIVERHGGKIWAQSELGKGTTVTFSLPKSPITDG